MICEPWASALRLDSNQEIVGFRPAYLAGLGASPGFFMICEPWASALRLDSNQEIVGFRSAYLAGLGASPGWIFVNHQTGKPRHHHSATESLPNEQ
jgi:hypothetical protein